MYQTERRSFDEPGEIRVFPHGRAEIWHGASAYATLIGPQ